jgi:hypothetical protein
VRLAPAGSSSHRRIDGPGAWNRRSDSKAQLEVGDQDLICLVQVRSIDPSAVEEGPAARALVHDPQPTGFGVYGALHPRDFVRVERHVALAAPADQDRLACREGIPLGLETIADLDLDGPLLHDLKPRPALKDERDAGALDLRGGEAGPTTRCPRGMFIRRRRGAQAQPRNFVPAKPSWPARAPRSVREPCIRDSVMPSRICLSISGVMVVLCFR